MKRVLRQPIVHFLALAGGLFVAHTALNPDAVDDRRILVDDAALQSHLQFKTGAFDDALVQRQLAAMTPPQLAQLEQELVAQEALYREAKALGLASDDFVIRQRLIQKMQYLISGFEDDKLTVRDAEVAAYYQQHGERYRQAPAATFSHVFIGADKHPDPEAAAAQLLAALNRQGDPVAAAVGVGDRFPYHYQYVERSRNLIAAHFGGNFAEALLALQPDQIRWQGPIASAHGLHLVLLTANDPGGLPPLASIYPRVAEDTRQWLREQRTADAIERLVARYEIRIQHGFGAAQPPGDNADIAMAGHTDDQP